MTTTRYYLHHLGHAAPTAAPAPAALWDNTGSLTRRQLLAMKPLSSAVATTTISETTAGALDVLQHQYIHEWAGGPAVLDAFRLVAGCRESLAGNDASLVVAISVISGGVPTLAYSATSANEFSNASGYLTRLMSGDTDAVPIANGDLIVVELGFRHASTDTTARASGIAVGAGSGSGGGDLDYISGVAVQGTGSDNRWPWIELTVLEPPGPPTGLEQTAATTTSVGVAWTAPAAGEAPTSYELRVDGGAPTDVGLVTAHTIGSLAPATEYLVEVRSIAATGASAWVSVVATTSEVSGEGVRLEAGHTYGTQLLGDTYSITVRRGLRSNGVTDDLEPATMTAIIKGSESVSPLANDDLRPGRPIRLRATLDGVTWVTLCTGKIQRARVQYEKDDAREPEAYRLHLTATDLVSALAAAPSEVVASGTLTQRVAAVMDPTGLPYTVDDPNPTPTSVVATDARDVIGQLRLIRDTDHAVMFVDRDGVLAVMSDHARPRVVNVPDWLATDDSAADGIHYTQLTPTLDTDAVVNILKVKLLNGGDNPETTHTDEESRTAWGDHPQSITVNAGLPETHADLWLASRVDPDLLPESLTFIVLERSPLLRAPDGRADHLAAAVGIELYDTVRVTRAGIPTADLLVREIAHIITPARWTVEIGLRVPEVLATRWMDVPPDLTWNDVPPDLTWRDAVNWHPYLDEGA